MSAVAFTLRVRYAETDAQGIVHHANYLVWFEEGRSELLRRAGCSYSNIEAAGFHVVVAEAEVRYRAPVRYEDDVTIETQLLNVRGRLLVFGYRVMNAAGALIAEGRTRHMVLDRELRPVALPTEIQALLIAWKEEA